MDDSFKQLVSYVNAATDLAESLEADLKEGDEISSDTVLKLSQFIVAANAFRNITDIVGTLN